MYFCSLTNLEKGKTVKSKQNYSEQSLYIVMCCYIYIYSLLRHLNFDLDKAMRTMLICQMHSDKKQKQLKSVGCCCLYSITAKSILKSLKDSGYREKEISKHICSYFEAKDNKELKELKEDITESFLIQFNNILKDHEMSEVLSKRFRIAIPL